MDHKPPEYQWISGSDTAGDLRRDIERHIASTLGQDPAFAEKYYFFKAAAHAVRDRLVDRWIHTQRSYYSQRGQAGLLSLHGVSARPLSQEQPHQHADRGAVQPGPQAARLHAGGDRGARMGCGSRERRSRTTRLLLHGFLCHVQAPGLRVRHPLRLRHLLPGDRERLPGGEMRQLAPTRRPLGIRKARAHVRGALLREGQGVRGRDRPLLPELGRYGKHHGHGLRHPDPGVWQRPRDQHAPVGGQIHAGVQPGALQHRASTSVPWRTRCSARTSPRSSIPAKRPPRGGSFASSSSTSSSPPPSRTSSAGSRRGRWTIPASRTWSPSR